MGRIEVDEVALGLFDEAGDIETGRNRGGRCCADGFHRARHRLRGGGCCLGFGAHGRPLPARTCGRRACIVVAHEAHHQHHPHHGHDAKQHGSHDFGCTTAHVPEKAGEADAGGEARQWRQPAPHAGLGCGSGRCRRGGLRLGRALGHAGCCLRGGCRCPLHDGFTLLTDALAAAHALGRPGVVAGE